MANKLSLTSQLTILDSSLMSSILIIIIIHIITA